MKTVTADYIAKEEAATRQPLELYKIWWGSTYWHHTNGDVSVDFGGDTYTPATIKRGSVSYDSNLEVSSLSVQFSRPTDPLVEFIAQNPVEVVWIEVSRLFRDQDPLEKSVIFIGQIKSVSIKGTAAEAKCVGFEFFFSMPIPIWRYQPQCNWSVFDANCGKSSSGFTVTAVSVTVGSDGLQIIHADFDVSDDGYWKWGYLVYGDYKRMIVGHTGTAIDIRYKIASLVTGETVTVYAGCDGDIDTCVDKFSNVDNFGGHPYIPLDNPVTWVNK